MPFPENADAIRIKLPAIIRDEADHIAARPAPAPSLRGIVVQLPQRPGAASSVARHLPAGAPDLLSRNFRVAIHEQSDFRPFDCAFRDQEIEQRSQSPLVAWHA